MVFGLLQALILNERGQLLPIPDERVQDANGTHRTIILAIEEPELYIHPQMQRLIYGVLKDFAVTDQMLYTTHSPVFVDVAIYESIALVRKDSVSTGTCVRQCAAGTLEAENERKTLQFLSSFGLVQNQMFFAKKVVLAEGEQDIIAILATGRALGLFREFPEESGYTLIQTDNKEQMPKYMKLLNAFGIPFVVLHELDGEPDTEKNQAIRNLLNGNKSVELLGRLEDTVGHSGHFKNTYAAKKFFESTTAITEELKARVQELFGP